MPGILLIWIILERGSAVLAADVGCKMFRFFCITVLPSVSFSFCLGDGSLSTEMLSQRTVKAKTAKQSPAGKSYDYCF